MFSLQLVHAAVCQSSIRPSTEESDRKTCMSVSGGNDTNRRLLPYPVLLPTFH
jgi:hypothetical protein